MIACWVLLAGLLLSARADAQVFTEQTIGFEQDCDGNNLAAAGAYNIFGYRTIDSALFAKCGISSIVGVGGIGQQQLHRPGAGVPSKTGDVVLSGAYNLSLTEFTFGPLEIIFSPAVNEVAFDALDLNRANGLTVVLRDANNQQILQANPSATNGNLHYSAISATPITRMVISYNPVFLADGWFIDQITFNAWRCGDKELEGTANGGTEQCDDGNSVQCDGCGNDCKTSIDGCLSGTTCIANGAVTGFGCATCVVPSPGAGALQFKADTEACDDTLFCTIADKCDGAGKCVGMANPCSDPIDCTDDACNEATDTCTHAIKQGSCLIDGTCFTNGEGNIDDPCERCDRSLANNAWSLRPQGARCGDPSCMDGIVTPYPRCSASGLCETQTPQSCMGAVCADSISCDGACTGDNDCVEETHCVNGVCEPDLPPGMPCERASQCDSNFCVDGVCCGDICNGPCVSCDLAGKVGMCSPHPGGTDPDNDCPDAQFCGGNGKCVGENRPDGSDCESGDVCASGFCADGVCCNAACDRSCEACDLVDSLGLCTPYIAGTDPEMECPNAQLCSAPGVCIPENRPNGTECTADAYCASGHCADGVCCDLACDGMCEACNSPEQVGVCIAFAAGTDPANECSGDAVCSGERSCVSYETRGNGLCSVGFGSRGSLASLASLLALCALLRVRRRSER